jgi:hypothetical protein
MPQLRPGFGEQDFLAYWSSAHLLATGGNPYNPESLKSIESTIKPEINHDEGVGLQVWNPPWLLLLLLPIGFLSFPIAAKVWIVVNVLLLGITFVIVWITFLNTTSDKGFVYILGAGFLFSPTLNLIGLGQITSIVLISLILGVWFLKSGYYLFGGFILLFTTVKPHLVYLVLLLIFVWVIRHRHWKVFLGMLAGVLLSVILISLILPGWFTSYVQLITRFPYRQVDTTTLGAFMAYQFNTKIFNYVGVFLLPLVFPLQHSLDRRDWLTTLNLALLISLPLSPYGFSFDEILLIPAIIQIIFWVIRKEVPNFASVLISLMVVLIYTVSFSIWRFVETLPYHMGLWQPLALCVIYCFTWIVREKYIGKLQPAI